MDNFVRRDCALVYIPLWESAWASATWKTAPTDPRSKIKGWMENATTGVSASAITKNDGSTQASYAVIFEKPDYPLELEFRAPSAPVQGLYVLGEPVETPVFKGGIISSFKGAVPIHVNTVHSNACGGEQLKWKMEAELRRIMKDYPSGSLATPTSRRSTPIMLGSTPLFDSVWTLNYQRSPST